jgi:uncharacterized protein YyaL (SSP411 family)
MSNQLAGETSPYLLQHAANPVDWLPWNPAALERARTTGKPILLSIGYSACHWCHVMAHESFEDPATAAVMNELYVNIKVDREERPDLDRIYQTAHHLLARRPGGWPLTVFLTPDDLIPFFTGTYFPPEARHGLPGFRDLLRHIAVVYRDQHDEIRDQNRAFVVALAQIETPADPEAGLTTAPLNAVRAEIGATFDAHHGGFGTAPKFPHPATIDRLFRHHAATATTGAADSEALRMAIRTLTAMAEGGIHDQLGGGFARYSVDERWAIPHFEKMLYDNGPLLALYARAWAITGEPLFRRTAEGIARWVMGEMQTGYGGYSSSLDADSEGHEGRFYVWTQDEARALLTPAEYRVVAPYFGLDRPANFEGRWHLLVARPLADVARAAGMTEPDAATLIETARGKLCAARAARVRPGRDDKVLTAWNALMITGMATAGLLLDRDDYVDSAERALDYLHRCHWRDGRLLATSRDGRAHLNAYLDDHALLIEAILTLLAARWRDGGLSFAIEIAEAMLRHFEDRDHGGFHFTADDHEPLPQRPKPYADDALPAGNGVAALMLGRLGHLLGNARYLAAGERTLRAAWPALESQPYAHLSLLAALEEHLMAPEIVVIRGRGDDLSRWRRAAAGRYAPRRLVLAIPDDAKDLPGLLGERRARDHTVAYVCRGTRCEAPIESLTDDRLHG